MSRPVEPQFFRCCPTSRFVAGRPELARTLGDVLRWRAQDSADVCAYRYLWDDGRETSITYRELDQQARAIAAAIQSYVDVGQRVLLVYPPGVEFIAAFMGCVYAGALAVPSSQPKPNRPMTRIATIAEDSLAALALTNRQTLDTLSVERLEPSLREMTWVASDDLKSVGPHDWQDPGVAEDDLAFLQYTSGSTRDPKGVMITHRNLMCNMEMIRCAFGIDPASDSRAKGIGVSWLPPFHDMGLIGSILESLYVGGTTILMAPTSFLKRPQRWLQAISQYGATVSGAPNFAYDLCLRKIDDAARAELDLSSWRVAFCGAEPVEVETLSRFAEAFGPCGFRAEAFYPCYGLAEATLLASGGDCDHRPHILEVNRARLLHDGVAEIGNGEGDHRALVSCGQPIHDEQIVIVNAKTRVPCPPGKVGEIWIRGTNVATGYWNQEEESDSTFSAQIAGDYEGPFLRTGDLGFVFDKQLYVTGRIKELIIIRGRNHYPRDLECTMQSAHECLPPMSGAAFSVASPEAEEIVLVQEVDRAYRHVDLKRVIRAIRRAVAEEHEVEVQAVVLIRQANLPRTTSGKLQRHVCRQRYMDGDLKILAQWTRPSDHSPGKRGRSSDSKTRRPLPKDGQDLWEESEPERVAELIEARLLEWLHERGGVSEELLDRNRAFAEFGIDSLSSVELIAELEQWSGVEMSGVAAWKYPTPATLARYLAGEISRGDAASTEEEEPSQQVETGEIERLLAEVERMSDAEANQAIESVDWVDRGDC